MAGLGMGLPSGLNQATGVNASTNATTTTSCGFAMSAGKHYHQHHHMQQQQQHHHQHRHSLTSRHRVMRTRSSGATHNIWDDQLIEVRVED